MRSPRRLLAIAAVILLVVAVLAAGLALLTILAAPLAVATELAVLALVTGVATHRRRGRRHGSARRSGPRSAQSPPRSAQSSDLRWTAQWPAGVTAEVVPGVRDELSGVLSGWGLAGESAEPALLVVTELLDNAVEYGNGSTGLVVRFDAGSVRVEVADGSPHPPRLRPADPLAPRGRGLRIVDGLATRWGWTDEPPGKVVWAVVPAGWSS
jgi:anti-sigma regulatory factor (Ser/Thr protein kinase)